MKLINKLKISLLISIGIILLLSIKTFAVTGIITEITVNMRKEPSTDSKKIMYVTQDDKVEVLEKVGDWYKIKAEGVTGYVFAEYVDVDDSKLEQQEVETTITATTNQEETETENTTEVKQEEVNNTNLIIKSKTQIRIIPNISSSVIYTVEKDIKIDVVEQLKDWSYVAISGLHGWVRTDKIVEENAVLPDEKDTGNKDETTTTKTETAEKENISTETIKQETKTSYIKYDTVNLREKASTSAKVIAKLKLNDKVTVLEKVNSTWSKVEIDGKTGYVSTELLADKKQEEKETNQDATADENTTSRDGETTSREETATKNKKEDTATNKTETTVKEDNTSKKEESKETTSSKVTGEDIVAYAKKYLGYKYVYGGTSPSAGFDCSGFTYYVYKHFGYTISRSSKAQANNGKAISRSNLQPGDLIIFKNQSLTAIGHVGIYVGDNKIIHASEPGVGVTITDINASGYNYNKRYVTARRII